MNSPRAGKGFRFPLLMGGALAAGFCLYLLAGRYPRPGLLNPFSLGQDEIAVRVLLSLRLPRALGALVLGAVLGGSGAVFQTIFGNPLVDAGFLGVSQGAAFGAALALLAGAGGLYAVAGLSFVFALAALWISLSLSKAFTFGGQVLRLLLAGLAVSAFFSALLGAVKYAADPLSQRPDIGFWTMGSLSPLRWQRLEFVLPPALASLVILILLRWRATLLSLDDSVSYSLGLRSETERALLAAAAAVGVATVTAVCGVVSWVGLVVPQVVRLRTGADGRSAIPLSMAGGALFVLISDGIARVLFPGELPLGIVTSILGAFAFALLLTRRKMELLR
ncbi:MAG: iron ABC transporter permease [Spirochaetia bacterium]|jgi:iron complex transport system permease protein|nr:iron ABC transporter permease [Spirochaetia bacterium]